MIRRNGTYSWPARDTVRWLLKTGSSSTNTARPEAPGAAGVLDKFLFIINFPAARGGSTSAAASKAAALWWRVGAARATQAAAEVMERCREY